jgi:hypothetical protein
MKKTYVFILVAIFLMTGCKERSKGESITTMNTSLQTANAEALSPVLTRNDILADYDYLISMIRNNYPFLNVNKRLNVAKLHNGHARVVGSQAEYQFLVNLYGNKKETQPWAELLSDPSVQNSYSILGNGTARLQERRDVQKSSFMVSFLDDQTAYINLPSFSEKFIPNEMKALSVFLPTVKDADRLIIDIRDNSGGSDAYWEQLVQQIIPEPIRWRSYNLIRGTYIKPFIEAQTGNPFESIRQLNELP